MKRAGRALFGRDVRREPVLDFHLHEYASYEQYRDIQIRHNLRKISSVWADEATLRLLCETLRALLPDRDTIKGLCHGSRNGYEQTFISDQVGFDALGTDIAPTATQFSRSVQWDYHDPRPEWTNHFDFVYSNSLDQSWQPRAALVTWLNQIRADGWVVIEHTESHGPGHAGEMDPFGVRPVAMPYVIFRWFGDDITMRILEGRKSNKDIPVWLFFIRRLVPAIA